MNIVESTKLDLRRAALGTPEDVCVVLSVELDPRLALPPLRGQIHEGTGTVQVSERLTEKECRITGHIDGIGTLP